MVTEIKCKFGWRRIFNIAYVPQSIPNIIHSQIYHLCSTQTSVSHLNREIMCMVNEKCMTFQWINTWFGSFNSPFKGANCWWMFLWRMSAEFAMLGIIGWISPGWDECNGGKAMDISRGNPRPEEGPGRCWRIWYIMFTM